jgi:alkylation response protein AidB-like acyl-CoA dehydrogenase
MNFELLEEQAMLKAMVREFAENEISPHAKRLERERRFPTGLLKKLGDLGILGMSVPEEYGGTQTDSLSLILAIEEISRCMPALAVIVSVHCSLFCYAIGKYGTEEQKKRYFPKAASGEILGAFSLTEPGAGSDAMGLKTKAERTVTGEYVLNGTKSWVTGGGEAGAIIIFARTDLEDGRKKLSAFIVDTDSPGFKVSKIEDKMGLNASLTAELVLENCLVPADNLLWQEGKGASIAFHCLDGSRIGIAAQSIGLSQRALDEGLIYSKQREAFGKPIASFQAIQFMLADSATQLEAARLLTYQAACLKDKGLPFTKEAAMAKLFASEAANKIVYDVLQIHGAYGYSQEFMIEQLYREARVLSIYEGTSEIQRMVIARELLK